EAMKMEISVHAETSGIVESLQVAVGQQVDAKDLLINLK
ncbi:MAG: hypothetical protein HWE34_05140, partial [Methylocystaceae bacterium]|nr:hypothetical protein [Methylocystaceae bacterium]